MRCHKGVFSTTRKTNTKRLFKKGKHYPKEWIQDIKYSQNGNFLAVGSHDNKIYVYRRKPKVENFSEDYKEGRYELYCVCAKHSSYITHIDFSDCNLGSGAADGSMKCDPEKLKKLFGKDDKDEKTQPKWYTADLNAQGGGEETGANENGPLTSKDSRYMVYPIFN